MKKEDENSQPKGSDEGQVEKPYFGTLKPLTAIQIISLIVPSSPVGAGACY